MALFVEADILTFIDILTPKYQSINQEHILMKTLKSVVLEEGAKGRHK